MTWLPRFQNANAYPRIPKELGMTGALDGDPGISTPVDIPPGVGNCDSRGDPASGLTYSSMVD